MLLTLTVSQAGIPGLGEVETDGNTVGQLPSIPIW